MTILVGLQTQTCNREIAASEIIGRTIMSKRFAEKILSVISKYHQRPHDLKLLIHSAMLLYNDEKQAADKTV
jgi:menaquinone-dependent protoporphyrinogen IX oxidase